MALRPAIALVVRPARYAIGMAWQDRLSELKQHLKDEAEPLPHWRRAMVWEIAVGSIAAPPVETNRLLVAVQDSYHVPGL